MSLTPEAKQTLLTHVAALEELPIERIVGILGGADPKEISHLYRLCSPIELSPQGLQEARAIVENFDARRLQHEIEHLGGKVCYNTDGTIFSTLGYGLNPAEYMNQQLRPRSNLTLAF